MRVLVAYGSKRGGTEGIARIIGDQLRADGFEVDVKAAGPSLRPAGYDAVIVGGALYGNRWYHTAAWFVRRNHKALRKVPTYLFSSGWLGGELSSPGAPPVPQVRFLASSVGAKGYAAFGGRLLPDAHGVMAHLMAETLAGDWRDPDEIKAWAHEVAGELAVANTAEGGRVARLS